MLFGASPTVTLGSSVVADCESGGDVPVSRGPGAETAGVLRAPCEETADPAGAHTGDRQSARRSCQATAAALQQAVHLPKSVAYASGECYLASQEFLGRGRLQAVAAF